MLVKKPDKVTFFHVNLLPAMLKRSKKQDSTMMQYYLVIGAFVAVCVAAVLYVLLNPKKSFAQMPVIDESQILVHNGRSGSNYQ
jgi:hypothetical protein